MTTLSVCFYFFCVTSLDAGALESLHASFAEGVRTSFFFPSTEVKLTCSTALKGLVPGQNVAQTTIEFSFFRRPTLEVLLPTQILSHTDESSHFAFMRFKIAEGELRLWPSFIDRWFSYLNGVKMRLDFYYNQSSSGEAIPVMQGRQLTWNLFDSTVAKNDLPFTIRRGNPLRHPGDLRDFLEKKYR